MKTKNLLVLFALLLVSLCSTAQTQFWSESFEDAGSITSGSRASTLAEFACTSPVGYFKRTTGTETNAGFTNMAGSKFFAAMNVDLGTTCTNNSISAGQTITWSGIDITGKTGLSFKGLFGANSIGTVASFQGTPFAASGTQDSLVIQYRINGGAWTKIIGLYSDLSQVNAGPLRVDTDGDFVGDGATMTSALTELTANIAGTGTTLDLRFAIFDNNGAPGSMAIDNFRLLSAPACNMTASLTSQTNVLCNGGSNGAATVAAANGTGTLTYNWTPGNPTGDGTASVSGLTSQVYTCTITDANSCTATQTVSITQPTAITSSVSSQTNVSCNGGTNGAATVAASGGTGTLTYSWSPSGGTAASATGLSAQVYTVTITDANTCSKTQTVSITQPTAITSSVSSQTNVSCNGGTNGAATVAASGGTGTLTYSWSPSGGTAASATGLSAQVYTVTITDANTCSKTQTVSITQPTAITSSVSSQTNVSCNGGTNGAATVAASGGTGTLTYSWSPSGGTAASATGLSAQVYTVTITDANTCSKTQTVSITQPTAITSSVSSQTNISCNGGTNGAATVAASGGTGTLTYSWSPSGGTAASATGLSAQVYTVTITDANTCSKTQTVSITQPTAITSSVSSQTNVSCNGGTNGAATVTASGGTGTLTYSWSPSGGTAASATGLSAQVYTVTITDANTCSKTQTVSITQPTAITSSVSSQTNVSCNGGTNGSATILASGGTGTLTYSWSPSGGTAASATGLSAQVYTVTITDANTCSKTQTVSITQPTAITSSVSSQTNIACNGGTNGSATILASGGTGTLAYSWSPSGGTAATATGLSAQVYTVTITDANTCSKTQTVSITQPTAITSSVSSQTNVSCNGGTNGSATILASGGTGTLTYSWSPSGGTAATATGLSAQVYTVTITDANTCSKTQTVSITQPTAITSSVSSQTNIACNGGTNGSATILASGGTGTLAYSWSPSGGTAATATGLSAQVYTVTITDANTCSKTQTVSITQPTAITSSVSSQTNIACNGGTNGSATILASGGTGTLAYSWSPSGGTAASATGLSAQVYTVTITDANTCSKTQTVSITQPTAITSSVSSQTNVSCNGGTNGAATVAASGGTGTLTYSWSPSGGTAASATGLSAQVYTVTITDANTCSKTQTVSITQPTAITSSVSSQTNISCNGGTNGAATVAASGGTGTLTYSWSPSGGTAASATGLSAQVYTVTITDANTCSKTQTVSITQPTAITSSVSSQTNVSCNGGTNGAATVTASGGTGTLTYSWSPSGGTAASATGLSAQVYTVTITDANTCSKTQTVSITQPTAITSSVSSQTNVSCNGGTNGSATILASGGTGTLTYSWSPSGGTAASATGLSAQVYTVTITDANTCSKTQTVSITQPTAITSSVSSQTNVSCNGGTNGAATVAASGGTGTLAYSWSPSGGTAATATGLSAQVYTVTITDANTCSKTQTVSITQPTAITSSVSSQTNIACNGGTNGSATILASGGTGTLAYSWSPSGGTAATATGLSAQVYTVTITDANTCSKTQTVSITQPTAITSSVSSQTNVSCNGGTNGSATILASGGTGTLAYSWSPSGGTAATATGLSAQVYTVTITDANTCSKTQTVSITQPTAITSSVSSQTNIACNGGTNGSATILASGGTGTLVYSWSPSGGTAATATGLSAQVYTVTITDANTCSKTQTVSITQPTAITSSVSSQTNVSCNGGTNGSATVAASGGTGTLTYAWAPSGGTAATATGLSAQVYTVTITDANTCSKTQTVSITQPTAITSSVSSQTNISCNGGTNGSATILASGGTGTLVYSWSPSGGTAATATGLSAQVYTVTITDANTCSKTQTVSITQPTAITSSVSSQTNIACNGGTNGSATILASGGTGTLAYSWSPSGGTAASATGLSAQVYTVTITDANTCSKTQTVSITQPTAITSSVSSQTNIACNGGTNGSATILASGGTGTLAYSWSPSGGTAATATGLSAQVYTVTITDANTCSKTQTVSITQPTAITSSVSSQTNISCNGGTNGAATVTASGGTGTLTYSWSPSGGTAATATGLSAQVYTVTITDANTCSKTQTVSITQPTALQLVVSNDTNICSATVLTINAAASGGTPTYAYNWTPGNVSGASRNVSPTVTTNYIVTVTDANSCTKKDTVIVSVGGVLAQSNQVNSTSIDGDDTSTSNVVIGNLNFLYNEECKIVASVKDNPALGTITGYVTVIDTVPSYQGRPFVSRWYQVTPQNNGPGSVNLYFTQQDFDDYNVYANLHGFPRLPQNPTDQVGIDSLVVTKISGGDFNNNTGTFTLVNPDSVKWNNTLHFWTVSISIPSFSQFLVHAKNAGGTPLYVNISDFNAKKENGTTGLYWNTQREIDNVGFDIQRSNDGKVYQTIGSIGTKAINGNSNTTLSYSYRDKNPFTGMNFYRLAEKDKQGKIVYSDVRAVNFDGKSDFNCYPNPVQAQMTVEYNADKDEQMDIRITDVMGKVVMTKSLNVQKGFNKAFIEMSGLSQGIYNIVVVSNSGVVYTSKVTKQ